MSSQLQALPLARRGESFLLQTGTTDRASILVDTGRKLDPSRDITLATTLTASSSSLRCINRLVLTHEDADHCEGAPQFIQEWTSFGRTIEQAWLPALWMPAAGTGVRNGWNISRIIKGAFEAAPEIEQLAGLMVNLREEEDARGEGGEDGQDERNTLENITRPFRYPGDEAATAQRASLQLDELFHPAQEGADDGRATESDYQQIDEEADEPDLSHAFDCPWSDPTIQMCLSCAVVATVGAGAMHSSHADLALVLAWIAIQTHANIGPAVAACRAHSIRIRWFDYLLFASTMKARGGDNGFFTPVNAVELVPRRVKVSPRNMFLSLFLTRANRESLVFLRHEADGEPALLFTADSRLKAGRRPFSLPPGLPTAGRLLATAPHHGSRSNQAAYKVMASWLGPNNPLILVQNGGHAVRKAAAAFKAVSDHLCVRCIGSPAAPQLVTLNAPNGTWQVPKRHAPCTCP
jgi:hypothetical protein